MWITKQVLAFLFCFTRELNLYTPLMSISHIQICYQLLQTYSAMNPPWIRHESAMNPAPIPQPTLQPFCLSGDNSWTYGRLTGIKKKHPLPTSRILSRSGSRPVRAVSLQAKACSASCRFLRFRVPLVQDKQIKRHHHQRAKTGKKK